MIEARIPEAKFKPNVLPAAFIRRIERIAVSSNMFDIKVCRDCGGTPNFNILSLAQRDREGHFNIEARLIANPDYPDTVFAEIWDDKWRGPDPGYEEYVKSLRDAFRPLLATYNRLYRSQQRIQIQQRTRFIPRLSKGATLVFRRFCAGANKQDLHPYDWRRFYGFIRYCHARHVRLSNIDIEYLLAGEGFSEDTAEELAALYGHGRALLRVR